MTNVCRWDFNFSFGSVKNNSFSNINQASFPQHVIKLRIMKNMQLRTIGIRNTKDFHTVQWVHWRFLAHNSKIIPWRLFWTWLSLRWVDRLIMSMKKWIEFNYLTIFALFQIDYCIESLPSDRWDGWFCRRFIQISSCFNVLQHFRTITSFWDVFRITVYG